MVKKTKGNDVCKKDFVVYGTTTLGERGQLVIPVEARRELHIEKGDTFLVMSGGPHKEMLCMIPVNQIKGFIEHFKGMAEQLEKEIHSF